MCFAQKMVDHFEKFPRLVNMTLTFGKKLVQFSPATSSSSFIYFFSTECRRQNTFFLSFFLAARSTYIYAAATQLSHLNGVAQNLEEASYSHRAPILRLRVTERMNNTI
jgi:hypothetical protein